MKTQFASSMLECIRESLDPLMLSFGFRRRKQSIEFRRQLPEGSQMIAIRWLWKPDYLPGAIAHVYPFCKLAFPRIVEIAKLMAGNESMIADNEENVLVSQPVDFSVPKELQTRLIAYDLSDVSKRILEIKSLAVNWLFPFMDDYQTINSIASLAAKLDSRFLMQQHTWIYVAAALIILNRPQEALAVLDTRLSRPALKRQYADAFAYATKCIERRVPVLD